jgi:hypothetical protein
MEAFMGQAATLQNLDPVRPFGRLESAYVRQQDDRSCSVASLAMVVNAIRAERSGGRDPLLTQDELLRRVNSAPWWDGVLPGGQGITLDQLAEVARSTFSALGLEAREIRVERVEDASFRTRKALRDRLRSTGPGHYLIGNFDQGVLTGDGHFGHFSPLVSAGAGGQETLVLDTDRHLAGPYLAGEAQLLASMMARDSASGRSRGLLSIRL